MADVRQFLDRSRLYRAGLDEQLYRDNILWRMMRALAVEARSCGIDAKRDIQACMESDEFERQHFFAYFAGANARAAFTHAAMVLTLNEAETRHACHRKSVSEEAMPNE